MPFGLQLQDAQAAVIAAASIDGKTGATARHPLATITLDLNRQYRALRTRVCQLGYKQFLESSAAANLPGRLSGEDFIEVPLPAGTGELVGIDVQIGGVWQALTGIEFEQRRQLEFVGNTVFFPTGVCQAAPPGVYAIHKGPKVAADGLTIVPGAIAVWPFQLSAPFQLHSVQSWADITTATQIFMLYEAWDEWLIQKTAMTICARDGAKKRDRFLAAQAAWQYADGLVKDGAPRIQRDGVSHPSSYQGIIL